jgi:cobalt-zinc-cadmium efflux system protein
VHAHDHDHDHEGHGHEHGRAEAGPTHDHGHAGDHDHAHVPRGAGARKRLAIALVVTVAFMVAEAVGGVLSNSQALLADAAHMLSDAAALTLSLIAIHFAARPATARKSYGWQRLEILAALANGVALVVIAIAIFWESFERLRDPPAVDVKLMMIVAGLGFGANLASAYILHGDHHDHLNVRAAYLHVLGDLLGSIGALAGGGIMLATGWYAADPLVAALVGLLILYSAWGIVRQATDILLEAAPRHIDVGNLESDLGRVAGVVSIHDLHVWTISSGVHLMTCHAVVGIQGDPDDVLGRLTGLLRERYGIDHSTIQLEREDRCRTCPL